MLKNKFIILIVIALVVIFGGLAIWYLNSEKSASTTSQTSTSTFSPFGTTPENKSFNISETKEFDEVDSSFLGKNNEEKKSALIEIHNKPTSGFIFFTDKNGKTILRFIDRATGNAYEYIPASSTTITRLTNTTIPKIEEAFWSSNGDNVLLRYLENDSDIINTFSGKITFAGTSTKTGEMIGTLLSKNITEIAINPSGSKIFQVFRKSSGNGSFGTISVFDGTNKKQIFDYPITYWNVFWPNENIITLTTKASYNYPGFLFFLNTQTGSITRILNGIYGLSTITNGDGNLIAYSQSQNEGFSLGIYDNKKSLAKRISLPTLAEKCVWGNKNNKILYCAIPTDIPENYYPDAWYQGTESFADDIWKIDAEKEEVSLIYQIGSTGTSLDVENIKISSDDKYISFINKKDLSLWLLNISEVSERNLVY